MIRKFLHISLLLLAILCSEEFCADEIEYIDLSLPGGTKWKAHDEEGVYHYSDLQRASFLDSLPTVYEWSRLIGNCKWTWVGSGYRAERNNKIIDFLLYSKDTELDSVSLVDYIGGYYLFHPLSLKIPPSENDSLYYFKARLVSSPQPWILRNFKEYVDLGLPSGTKWHSYSTDELMIWDLARENKYKLPTKEQFEELLSLCSMDTIVYYYREEIYPYEIQKRKGLLLTGLNGRQIILNFTNYWTCDINPDKKWGAYAITIDQEEHTCSVFVNSKEDELSIHLVE